jgi:D-threo-aldose 1-dehydrogenase
MVLKSRTWQRIENGGLTFTELGFGTAPLGNLYRAIGDDEAQAILGKAWKGGVRYYDTAPVYGLGLSESRLNPFLRGRNQADYVLSTKAGRLMQVCSPRDRTGIGKWFDVPTPEKRTITAMMGSCARWSSRLSVLLSIRPQAVRMSCIADCAPWC